MFFAPLLWVRVARLPRQHSYAGRACVRVSEKSSRTLPRSQTFFLFREVHESFSHRLPLAAASIAPLTGGERRAGAGCQFNKVLKRAGGVTVVYERSGANSGSGATSSRRARPKMGQPAGACAVGQRDDARHARVMKGDRPATADAALWPGCRKPGRRSAGSAGTASAASATWGVERDTVAPALKRGGRMMRAAFDARRPGSSARRENAIISPRESDASAVASG